MNNYFNRAGKPSAEYLADEMARGYKVAQGFFIGVIVLFGIIFIAFVIPTL